jgi:hypothetical protein
MSINTGGDAGIPEDILKIRSTVVWGNKNLFFYYRTSSKQATNLIIPRPVGAARSSFQSTSTDTQMKASVVPCPSVNFKPSWSSP